MANEETPPISQDLTKDDFLQILIHGEPNVRAYYAQVFSTEIELFAGESTRVFQQLKDFVNYAKEAPRNSRAVWVFEYSQLAFNTLFDSFQFQICGYPLSAVNLSRQFHESVAMVLLLSHPKISTFDRFIKSPRRYPVHKALNEIQQAKNRKLLVSDMALDNHESAWRAFLNVNPIHNELSHASILAAALGRDRGRRGMLRIGAVVNAPEWENIFRMLLVKNLVNCTFLGMCIEQAVNTLQEHGMLPEGIVSLDPQSPQATGR